MLDHNRPFQNLLEWSWTVDSSGVMEWVLKGQAPGMLTGCEHNFAGFCLHVAVTRNKTQIQLLVVNINDW